MFTNEIWDCNEITVNDVFCFTIATEILSNDNEPKGVDKCCLRHDWDKWKVAIHAYLNSLKKSNVFVPIVCTPTGVKPISYKGYSLESTINTLLWWMQSHFNV